MLLTSDTEIQGTYLTACTENIQWLIDHAQLSDGELVIDGWAISASGNPADGRFLINGKEFADVHYPIHSPELGEIFWNTPGAKQARFLCRTPIRRPESFPDGFARLEFVSNDDQRGARRRAWYFPDPAQDLPIPVDPRIHRVIGVCNSTSYLLGGASIFKRFEDYLLENFGRAYTEFTDILDWGCGCGRLARHFGTVSGARLWGVDIDADNIDWCRSNLPHGTFSTIPLVPPTPLPANCFDLIIGISVLTHLSEENQFLWLAELRRLAKPGAFLMLSVHGLSQTGLLRPPADLWRRVEREGFVVTGRNSQLDPVMRDQDYYLDVIQSREYIRNRWGEYFTVLEITDAIAANQDLVVLRKD